MVGKVREMMRWIKVVGVPPKIGLAKRLSRQHNAWREDFPDGFYAFFSELHIRPVIKCFRSWGLKVVPLDGPPRKNSPSLTRERRKSPPSPQGDSVFIFPPQNKRRRKEDKEKSIKALGTKVSDIRAMAFSHSKTEVAFLLDVSIEELNRVLLAKNIEPIYFGYQCKRCDLLFQGESALRAFRTHILSCK